MDFQGAANEEPGEWLFLHRVILPILSILFKFCPFPLPILSRANVRTEPKGYGGWRDI